MGASTASVSSSLCSGKLFDCLPDSLILLILAKVEEAGALIRCSTVCRRFQKLVWQVPSLSFNIDDIGSNNLSTALKTAKNDAILTKTILQMSGIQHLKVFGSIQATLGASCVHALAMSSRNFLKSLTIEVMVRNGFPEVLIQNLACCRQLQVLYLRWHSFRAETEAVPMNLFPSFPDFPHLRSLTLENMPLSDEFVSTLLQHCASLESLNLSGISGLNSPVFKGKKLARISLSKWIHFGELFVDQPISSVTVDSPVVDLELRDSSALTVTCSTLKSLKVMATSQMKIDLSYPHVLEKLSLYAPPRSGSMLGLISWEYEAFMGLVKSCTSLTELELIRICLLRRGQPQPLSQAVSLTLKDLVGLMPDIEVLSIGPRILDSLVLGFNGTCDYSVFGSLRKLCIQLDYLSTELALCFNSMLLRFPGCKELVLDAQAMVEPQVERFNDANFMTSMLTLQRHHPTVKMTIVMPKAEVNFRSS